MKGKTQMKGNEHMRSVTPNFGNRKASDLIRILSEGYEPRPNYWVFYGARAFADLDTDDPNEAALAILKYFAPTNDSNADERRRKNGYTITEDPYTIRRIILRRAS